MSGTHKVFAGRTKTVGRPHAARAKHFIAKHLKRVKKMGHHFSQAAH